MVRIMDEIISYKMCAVNVRNAKLRNYLKYNFTITFSNKCFQTQFAVFVYCSYQIPTLSYSPPCACVLNTILTVVYLAQMDY